uniref:Uncharacterized protein n=1 Tax=Anguilla anguilla TaxID=7936 RepID=A0A0E9QGA2_ANGAN
MLTLNPWHECVSFSVLHLWHIARICTNVLLQLSFE